MRVGQAHIPEEAPRRRVGAEAEDVLQQHGDRRQPGPADEVGLRGRAGRGGLRRVVLVDRAGPLEDGDDVVQMVARDLVRERVAPHGGQPAQHHVSGGGPDRALPVTAARVVARMIGRQRRHPVRALEGARVLQVRQERGQPRRRHHARQQRPVSAHALDVIEHAAVEPIAVKAIGVAP